MFSEHSCDLDGTDALSASGARQLRRLSCKGSLLPNRVRYSSTVYLSSQASTDSDTVLIVVQT